LANLSEIYKNCSFIIFWRRCVVARICYRDPAAGFILNLKPVTCNQTCDPNWSIKLINFTGGPGEDLKKSNHSL